MCPPPKLMSPRSTSGCPVLTPVYTSSFCSLIISPVISYGDGLVNLTSITKSLAGTFIHVEAPTDPIAACSVHAMGTYYFVTYPALDVALFWV